MISMKRGVKPIFICFVGMDGSGKTSLSHKLVALMRQNNMETEYVWNRFEARILTPFFKIGKALFFQGKDIMRDYAEYSVIRKKVFQNRIIGAVYGYLLSFDYFWQIWLKVRIPLMRHKNIVCDRYIYDTVVDLATDLNYSDSKRNSVLRNFLRLSPKPDMIFLIDLPEEIAYQRKTDVPSINYLRERREIYLNIGKECGMTLLDGSKELGELENLILNKVKAFLQIDKEA